MAALAHGALAPIKESMMKPLDISSTDLREEEANWAATLTLEQRDRYIRLKTLSEYGRRRKRPGSNSDHSDMYDEFGLPT